MDNSYDNWKLATPEEYDFGCEAYDPEVEACDCGSPLEGGEGGLCSDCVKEALEGAADVSEEKDRAFFGKAGW